MSFNPTTFRQFARGGFGGRAASHFRGVQQIDNGLTNKNVVNRGQVGTVVYRSPGVRKNNFITGVTRDSSGNPLGNCSLDLYMTGADMIARQGQSDASGNFTFSNPGSGPFYIVAYKVGSPDVAGTTVNTLVAV